MFRACKIVTVYNKKNRKLKRNANGQKKVLCVFFVFFLKEKPNERTSAKKGKPKEALFPEVKAKVCSKASFNRARQTNP